jgi:hypothetical protein
MLKAVFNTHHFRYGVNLATYVVLGINLLNEKT